MRALGMSPGSSNSACRRERQNEPKREKSIAPQAALQSLWRRHRAAH